MAVTFGRTHRVLKRALKLTGKRWHLLQKNSQVINAACGVLKASPFKKFYEVVD
jgi:hypothetical protein